jgi:4'-phosphopantetheinyl transferase
VKVFWLVQATSDLPGDDDWLTAAEHARLRSLKIAKRRGDWRLGRWTAKHAIARAWPGLVPGVRCPRSGAVEIRPTPDGAPEVFVGGERAQITISLSHSSRHGFCTLTEGRVEMGCDIEQIGERSDRFIEDYFTADECAEVRALAEKDRPLAATLVWSAKESALKATREGLRRDTRAVEVSLARISAGREWSPLLVRHSVGKSFKGLWRIYDGFVLTVVAETEPEMISCRPA